MISQEITATIVRRPKLARALHILMIALCLVASIALYLVDNYTYKVVISLIMIAYTIFLLINSHIIRLILNIHN